MIVNKTVTAIILVAGNSTRFGQNRNKNFELVNGKSILSYSINAFNKNNYIDNIIVVIKQDDKETVEQIIDKENITKKISIVFGGNSRQESVYNAIKNSKRIYGGKLWQRRKVVVNQVKKTLILSKGLRKN